MKNSIRNFEINLLIIFIMLSNVIGISFNAYISIANNDAWIAPLLGMIFGFIPLFINLYIIDFKDNLDINQKNIFLFGKLGKLINLIIMGSICLITMIDFYNLTNFISSEYLYNTPQFFISFMFMIPILYLFIQDIKVILRVVTMLFFFTTTLMLISAGGLFFQTKIDNLMPFFKDGFIFSFIAGIKHTALIVLPTFIVTIIPKDMVRNKKLFKRRIIYSYIYANLAVFLITFIVLSCFGIELAKLYQYPVFNILKRVSFIDIFTRVESILAIEWIFYIFVAIVISGYYIRKTFESVFNIKNKYVLSFIFLCLLYISSKLFNNSTSATIFLRNVYPIILCVCLFIIPLCIAIKIKLFKFNKS